MPLALGELCERRRRRDVANILNLEKQNRYLLKVINSDFI